MDLGMSTEILQSQKLVISPELQQALKILHFSSQELHQYIENEIEINPLLDWKENGEYEDLDCLYESPVDWHEYFTDLEYSKAGTDYAEDGEEENRPFYESIPFEGLSLHDYLLEQLKFCDIDDTDKRIAAFIIGSLDGNGYCTLSKYKIAELLSVSRAKVNEIFSLVQSFDPPGVGARSLRECLLIQIKQMGKMSNEIKQIVLEHLRDIADNNLSRIAKSLNLPVKEVQAICDFIKTLEPKPGRKFSASYRVGYIVPDLEVVKAGDEYQVILKENAAPSLQINKSYQDLLSYSQSDDRVIAFIHEKLESACRLIKAIEQRKNTILKVAVSIFKFQKDFLDRGVFFLKPLSLRMIAEDIKVHESTVSRAINKKYAQTPRGVYELQYFFDHGVRDRQGRGISSESIKKLIQEEIKNENPQKPLSDQEIAVMLQKHGVEISRRTVNKYREELGIPNSTKRRRFS